MKNLSNLNITEILPGYKEIYLYLIFYNVFDDRYNYQRNVHGGNQ